MTGSIRDNLNIQAKKLVRLKIRIEKESQVGMSAFEYVID